MKLNSIVYGHLQMSAIYISLGSTMYLLKKNVFKMANFSQFAHSQGRRFIFSKISWVADGLKKICLYIL